MRDIKDHIGLRRYSPFFKGCWIALISLLLTVGSCDPTVNGSFIGEDAVTISAFIEENQGTYSRFWELINRTNLKNTLNAYNPNGNGYTLFMPSDEAFNYFISQSENYKSFEDLLNDTDFSNYLIRYHIVNRSIQTNDFPFGALPDTTATGDFLTIGFYAGIDSTIYRVNNLSAVIIPNIELTNGYIHVIEEVLEPIVYSSYDWILNNEDYSILSEAFTLTGIKDTMGIYRSTATGTRVKNLYTLLAEPDSIFNKNGIFTIDDLIERYQSPGLEITDYENELYQFTAYHILEGSYFLDEFTDTKNYNTYSSFPVQISSGIDIRINPGKDTLDIIIDGQDTTIINYVRINMNTSNILTKNGAIHNLRDILEVKTPGRTQQTFQFMEEPQINDWEKNPGEYDLIDPESLEVLFWTGPESIKYIKLGSSIPANNNDYIQIEGIFVIDYTFPRILPGKYKVELKAESSDSRNATIQVTIDGQRMGSSFDLTSGGNPYRTFTIGTVEFQSYETHKVSINALLPGIFKWDMIRFTPE